MTIRFVLGDCNDKMRTYDRKRENLFKDINLALKSDLYSEKIPHSGSHRSEGKENVNQVPQDESLEHREMLVKNLRSQIKVNGGLDATHFEF